MVLWEYNEKAQRLAKEWLPVRRTVRLTTRAMANLPLVRRGTTLRVFEEMEGNTDDNPDLSDEDLVADLEAVEKELATYQEE